MTAKQTRPAQFEFDGMQIDIQTALLNYNETALRSAKIEANIRTMKNELKEEYGYQERLLVAILRAAESQL